jgi:hypothetical protein
MPAQHQKYISFHILIIELRLQVSSINTSTTVITAAILIEIVIIITAACKIDRLCGLVVRVLGYRSGGPGSIPGTTRKKK